MEEDLPVVNINNLPNEIGARAKVLAGDHALRRKIEAQVFFIEKDTQQYYIIRRDFPSGALKTN
ncbi:MAG: hypothetical protein ACREHG_04740 [Candidatus Saccharimonadales bacterium]